MLKYFIIFVFLGSCKTSTKQSEDEKRVPLPIKELLTPKKQSITKLEKILVINLGRSEDRLANIQKQFHENGLELERFPAIYGAQYKDVYKTPKENEDPFKYEGVLQTLDTTNGYTYLFDRKFYRRMLGLGEIGNYLSLYEIYKKIVKEKTEPVLVIEDDIKISDHFKERVETLLSYAPPDWDVLYLFCFGKSLTHPLTEDHRFVDISKTDENAAGNQAVIYNLKGVQKLLNGMMPITMPSDVRARVDFFRQQKGPFHVYCSYPEIVSTDIAASEIDKIDSARKR